MSNVKIRLGVAVSGFGFVLVSNSHNTNFERTAQIYEIRTRREAYKWSSFFYSNGLAQCDFE